MNEKNALQKTSTNLPATPVLQNEDLQRTLETLQVETAKLSHYTQVGDAMVKAGLAPKGMNAQGAAICMLKGEELGFKPTTSLAVLNVINGKVGIQNEGATALLRDRGVLKKGTDLTVEFNGEKTTEDGKVNPDFGVTVSLHRVRHQKPFTSTFTIRDAQKAGLWGKGGPWSQYPLRMLQNRALGFLIRDYFSDVTLGLNLEAELADRPAPMGTKAATPAEPAPEIPDAFAAAVAAAPDGLEVEEIPRTPDHPNDTSETWDETSQNGSGEETVEEDAEVEGEEISSEEQEEPDEEQESEETQEDPAPDTDEPPRVDVQCARCGVTVDYPVGYKGFCELGQSECGGMVKVDDEGAGTSWEPETENTVQVACKCGKAALYNTEYGGRCPGPECVYEFRPATKDGQRVMRCYSKPAPNRPPLPLATEVTTHPTPEEER